MKRAARCLMFLQMRMFKWVSIYCKTQSSLFLFSESICQCLGYLPFFFFFFKRCPAICTCLKLHTGFHSWFWWCHFPLYPIISCDHFSWTSVSGTKAIFDPVDQIPRLVEPLPTSFALMLVLPGNDPLAVSAVPGRGGLWWDWCSAAGNTQGMQHHSQGRLQPLIPHFSLFTIAVSSSH